ncbi:hypothetical protein GOBAR_AA13121 [Gossypium barbadense]|uniref:Uncharacterized protein n=1 Tax=Gossypium barbadense TaxID=3634 RepID=A0A2P5XW78_GOSBA|nr:hypothetical protein GOBAR_AA13121 [Gossypium barbadense]
MSLKEAHESFSSSSKGSVHKDRRLQIEELDEWRVHKPITPDKPKLRKNELNTFPNQFKVGDKVLLDAADPHIVITTPNEEIPLTVLSIFPFGTVEVIHPKFGTFKAYIHGHGRSERSQAQSYDTAVCTYTPKEHRRGLNVQTCTMSSSCGKKVAVPTSKKRKGASSSSGPTKLSSSSPFPEDALVLGGATYNTSHSKASALPPSLRYLHGILAHTITRRRESTSIVNTHDAYFLWCMSHGHITDLAYFIALVIQHQTEWHKKGVISIGPYVTRLARHFGLLSTAAKESSLTLIGQMSPQGISSMLSMRMIEKR